MEPTYEVRIPESLYEQISKAAVAAHVTVEEFIACALQHRLDDDVLWLTPEQLAKV